MLCTLTSLSSNLFNIHHRLLSIVPFSIFSSAGRSEFCSDSAYIAAHRVAPFLSIIRTRTRCSIRRSSIAIAILHPVSTRLGLTRLDKPRMPDYAKVTVPKLRELLASRSLPTNGLKTDLIARLAASDAAASSPKPASSSSPAAAAPPPAAAAAATGRNAEEFHVDWEEPAHAAAPAAAPAATSAAAATTPAAAPARAHSRAPPAESQPAASKPVRKSIAALFDDPPKPGDPTAHTKTGNEPSSPSTVTSESAPPPPPPPPSHPASAAAAAASSPAAAAPAAAAAVSDSAHQFAANLPTTSLDDEIARRRKRAARFGLSAQESEALKTLERRKRFGLHDDELGDKKISGLDDALPERPQHQNQQYGRRNGGVAAAGGSLRGKRNGFQGGVQTGRVQKPGGGVLLNAEDRRKAEERKRRFAAA